VIALAVNSGLPAAFCSLPQQNQVAKKSDQPEPAKLQGKKPIKWVIFEKYSHKSVF
jgi:hypothetical protein